MRLAPFALALLLAAPAQAGQADGLAQGPSIDPRWLPWIGCWRPAPQRPSDGGYLCVVPDGTSSARILTISGAQIVAEETIVPDGTDRPADDPSCRGSQRRAWSADGQRMYASAELVCDNQPARKVSGLSTLTAEGEWIDVQVVVVSGSQERVRIGRHQRSDDQPPDASLIAADVATRAATSPRGARLTIANVIEASALVAPRVLEALIFETRASFPIDRKQLISMDDAGVADEVIDVMVAFSFPQKFKVTRSAGASSWGGFDSGGLGWGGAAVTAEYAWPWYLDPYYSYVGFPYWGVGGDYYYPGWGVDVGGGDGAIVPAEPHGRVVNGRGYTQVMRAPEGGQPTPRGRSGGDSSSASSADGGSSSGGTSSASSGGYSSGGGGDSGRTAVPR